MDSGDTGKRLILRLGLIFIGILLFLTFFSRTIYDFNLPSVVVDYPREGAITRSANGRGIVDFAVKDSYYAHVPGKVYLLVAEGEAVVEGGGLYSIVADLQDLQRSLEEYLRNEDALKLRLQKARADRGSAQLSVSDAAINAALKDLADAQILYEAGAIARRELEEKQTALDELQSRFQQGLKDVQKSVGDLQFAIDQCELEMADNRREILRLEEQIDAQGEIIVPAESSGIVRQISSLIDNGAFVGKNELIMKIGVTGAGFSTTFELPESVNYLNIGDTVAFNISSRNIYGISGEICGLIIAEGRLKATVQFVAADAAGGEVAEVKVQDTSELFQSVLPNSAVRSDSYGNHVLYVEAVKGFFGYEYYARRINVWLEANNSYNTAIRIFDNDGNVPIIINSDKAISEGDRVRIVGGSDLVEIR
jgi:multidrug efflux pump subunit AcrA (membrane-fusion protein)